MLDKKCSVKYDSVMASSALVFSGTIYACENNVVFVNLISLRIKDKKPLVYV